MPFSEKLPRTRSVCDPYWEAGGYRLADQAAFNQLCLAPIVSAVTASRLPKQLFQ